MAISRCQRWTGIFHYWAKIVQEMIFTIFHFFLIIMAGQWTHFCKKFWCIDLMLSGDNLGAKLWVFGDCFSEICCCFLLFALVGRHQRVTAVRVIGESNSNWWPLIGIIAPHWWLGQIVHRLWDPSNTGWNIFTQMGNHLTIAKLWQDIQDKLEFLFQGINFMD